MKLGRFATGDGERIGIFHEDEVRDITDSVDSFTTALETVTAGGALPTDGPTVDVDEIEYLPPTTPSNTVFATALNYHSHIEEQAEETGADVPERPLMFLKLYRSLVGHDQPITYHTDVTEKIDYEAELGAVIGKRAWKVDADDALEYVAGYTVFNDISARDVQRMQMGDSVRLDWFSAKAMQHTSPVGPYIVTTEDIPDPQALHITSRLNGTLMQDEGTNLMIRSVADLVAFLSTRVELEPGDVVATGTPEGVGAFQDIRLETGDTVDIEISDIGTLSNTVVEQE